MLAYKFKFTPSKIEIGSNLYRYLAGQKEFEVELQFRSDLLSHPDKLRELGVADDAKTPALYLRQSETDLKKKSGEVRYVCHKQHTCAQSNTFYSICLVYA